MVDRNMQNFYGRLGRIERTHESGGGFEADGTIGMSYYTARRRPRRRLRIVRILLVAAAVFLCLKAGLHVAMGPSAYDFKVAALREGTDVDRAGAWLMQADPATLMIADQIRRFAR
jgi:hypothetical protein